MKNMNIKSLRGKKHQFPNDHHEEMYNKIKEYTTHMDEIQKSLEKQQQNFFAIAQQSKVISESLKKFSNDSSYYNSRIPITDCLQRASEWQSTIGEVFNHLGNLLYDRTTQPLKETIKIQFDMVKEGKKKLKSLKVSDVDVGNKSEAHKKEHELYEKTSKETLQLYNDSQLALENSTVHSLLSAYEGYHDFYQKGTFQLTKIKSDIENYKKVILETNKVAAKLRNYVPRKTFGIKLEEIFARESSKHLPLFLEEIFKYLEKEAPNTEGVFRISAGKSSIEALQQKIESGQPLELNNVLDTHVVSSVLKLFFRSLPEPLIFYSSYQKYLSLSKLSAQQQLTELKRLISSLPVCNQTVLKHILGICNLVNQHKDVTKMDLNNLAVVIGPNILESIPGLKAEDIQKPETFAEFNSLFIMLVENCQYIFPQTSQVDIGARLRSQTEPNIRNQTSSAAAGASPTTPSNISPKAINSPDFVMVEKSPLSSLSSSNDLSNNNNNLIVPQIITPESSTTTVPPPQQQSPQSSTPSTPNSTPSSMPLSPSTTSKKKTNNDDYLAPIDMQIYFINISSNFSKLRSYVDRLASVEEGIQLIKIFKQLSDQHISNIKQLIGYSFTREKPESDSSDDKITRVKKTLLYTHDISMDLIKEANNTFESSSIDEPTEITKKLGSYFKSLDECISNQVENFNNDRNEITSSTASLSDLNNN
ncbi:hypothetical protein CYY_005872 [Polysphondylium violaceum]|uniref:Rho-GAP domain-containing protein n=1 Tax=Polysphondylium violaceum TaxID=133409 RepID=A0A8J4PRA7_9MYCE|nr:hypothetical protein CYY_005872 [Polysphondylium violaceum]